MKKLVPRFPGFVKSWPVFLLHTFGPLLVKLMLELITFFEALLDDIHLRTADFNGPEKFLSHMFLGYQIWMSLKPRKLVVNGVHDPVQNGGILHFPLREKRLNYQLKIMDDCFQEDVAAWYRRLSGV